jgi:hypothetical protein
MLQRKKSKDNAKANIQAFSRSMEREGEKCAERRQTLEH